MHLNHFHFILLTFSYHSTDAARSFYEPDWSSIVTPINTGAFRKLLEQSNYDRDKTEELIRGFEEGFDIGYEGKIDRRDTAPNLPLGELGTKTDLWNKVMKEVEVNRYAGPFKFEDLPFQHFIQSPLGLVLKDGGRQTRLIFHLSYDFRKSGNPSLNACIPGEKCKVKYRDLDWVIENLRRILEKVNTRNSTGRILQILFYGKSDLKSAFRVVPVKPSQRCWLLMQCQDPESNEKFFFVEKNLPFEASISCRLFQDFSCVLQHIFEHLYGTSRSCTNYLDDFLFVSPTEDECNTMVRIFLHMCERIGCPVSLNKMEWASSQIVFLGVILDGVAHCLAILENKRIEALNRLSKIGSKRTATVEEL